jgi:YD repeat-containing protein
MNRRLTAQDARAPADSSYGTWFYAYDNEGNVTAITNPKPLDLAFSYDALNRRTAESDTTVPGNEVTYTYDTCGYGKTQLCQSVFRGSATTTFTYHLSGLKASEAKTIDNIVSTTSYSYDRLGNVTNIIYPDSSEVKYTYNVGGLLETVQQRPAGGAFSNIVSDFDYAPTGKVKYKFFGNGAQTFLTSPEISRCADLFRPNRLHRVLRAIQASALRRSCV